MQNKRLYNIMFVLFFFTVVHLVYVTVADSGNCQAQTGTPSSTSINDTKTFQSELQKAGINLTTAEIQKGKEALEKQGQLEKQAKPEEPKLVPAIPESKPATGIKPVEPPKEHSLFSRSRKIGNYQEIETHLRPFGSDFFSADAQILAERNDIPVPLHYVVGPGDQVKILLWGRISAQHSLVVDRDGKITIPDIGPIQVAGMTFDQMSQHIISKANQIVGTNIDISMGALRTIPIFVLGDVNKPGAYTISALATITDALMMARGPSSIGSMRRVELRRNKKVITQFDLYDLFLKGDKSKDIILQAGDVVFVPVTGPLVGVTGNVKRPAIYELKDKFDLHHVLELAGGTIPSAYTQQMQVERIVKNEKQVVIDIDEKTLSLAGGFTLQDADLVKIFSIVDANENAVYLNGNVKRPGKYAHKPGMRIKDIISNVKNDLEKETYLDYALIKRENPPNREIVLIPFNLGRLLIQNDMSYNYELSPKDQIFIFPKALFENKPAISIEGEIRGSSTAMGEESEKEIAEAAVKADIQDVNRDKKILEELREIKGLLNNDTRHYLYIAKIEEIEDEIVAQKRPTPGALSHLQIELERIGRADITARLKRLEKKMRVVRRLNLDENMKVRDAILLAGGLTPDASLDYGEIIRKYPNNEYRTTYFNVAKAMANDPLENILLQDEDQIIVHSIWEKNPKKSVSISGNVTNPGIYQHTANMTVRDLIFKAGNVLDSAYLEEAEITSVKVIDGMFGILDHKEINLRKALDGDSAHNLTLSPYDRLLVKSIADYQVVRVITLSGQVSFPGKYAFRKGEKLSDIIDRAGGFTPYAYLRGAFFSRVRVRALQQKGLEEMTARMERELLSAGTEQLATALSKEEIAAMQAELAQKRRFIDLLRETKAQGRMTIYLADAKTLRNTEFDFELEDGDELFVPEKHSVVNVLGSVMTQNSHLYSDKLNYKDYIDFSGGYSYYADKGNVYILKVDGSAMKVSNGFIGWNSSRSRWEMTSFGGAVRQVEPGDTIVVPEQVDRISWLREIKDITQILMNIAVVAGVTIKLF